MKINLPLEMKKLFVVGFYLLLFCQISVAQKNIKPLISSYNFRNNSDFWESVGNGICNFEADVMYIYGKNYVTALMPDSANHKLPTLSEAYLYPLYNQFKKNNGEIIPGFQGEVLLILNFAFQPVQSYKQLAAEIRPFQEMLYTADRKGKLRILIKDKAALEIINSIKPGFLGLVGSLSDVEKNVDSEKMPVIELNFTELTGWKGTGNIPFEDFVKIKDLVAKIHAQKKKVILTNTPVYKTVSEFVKTSGIDFLVTNDPMRMTAFF
ncbi:MAG TPA: hypothetical protein PLG33_00175 [Prolixibacteraceae bacterium]|nr:hypothetical protein [Prolixibacteraceae bacterium]